MTADMAAQATALAAAIRVSVVVISAPPPAVSWNVGSSSRLANAWFDLVAGGVMFGGGFVGVVALIVVSFAVGWRPYPRRQPRRADNQVRRRISDTTSTAD